LAVIQEIEFIGVPHLEEYHPASAESNLDIWMFFLMQNIPL
jgi:hypothetical protein